MSTLKKLWNNKKAAAPLQKRRTPESKCSLQQEVIFSQEWVHKKCLSWLCRRPTGMFPNFQLRLRTPHCWKADYNFLKTGNGNIGRVYDWQLQNARCQCVGTIATLNTAFAPDLENVGEPLHYFFNPYSSFLRTTRVINHSNFNSFQTNLGPTRINSKSRLFMLCLLFSEILCCKWTYARMFHNLLCVCLISTIW